MGRPSLTRLLKHISRTVGSYDEFKTRLAINGICPYEIGTLKTVSEKMFRVEFKDGFVTDMTEHIDDIVPLDYIPGLAAKCVNAGKARLPRLDALLLKIWFKKHFGITI